MCQPTTVYSLYFYQLKFINVALFKRKLFSFSIPKAGRIAKKKLNYFKIKTFLFNLTSDTVHVHVPWKSSWLFFNKDLSSPTTLQKIFPIKSTTSCVLPTLEKVKGKFVHHPIYCFEVLTCFIIKPLQWKISDRRF